MLWRVAGKRQSYNRVEVSSMPKNLRSKEKRLIGRFIVADPAICHGKPTFRGTRILVSDVLDQVASGMAWETIVEEWRGDIPEEAVAEAVRLASQAFHDHSSDYVAEEYVLERVRA